MGKIIFKGVCTILLMAAVSLPLSSRSHAQMSVQQLSDLYEFTAFTHYYTQVCTSVPYIRNSRFKKNFNFLKDQLKIVMMEEDEDLSEPQAELDVTNIQRKAARDARYFREQPACEGEEQEVFVDHYEDLAQTETEELAELVMTANTSPQERSDIKPVR